MRARTGGAIVRLFRVLAFHFTDHVERRDCVEVVKALVFVGSVKGMRRRRCAGAMIVVVIVLFADTAAAGAVAKRSAVACEFVEYIAALWFLHLKHLGRAIFAAIAVSRSHTLHHDAGFAAFSAGQEFGGG